MEKCNAKWKGYEAFEFVFNGYDSIIICPKRAREDKRWIWRTEFLGAFDEADIAMLEKGWYLAYHKISGMWGCPQAVELMNKFQDYIVEVFGLYPKSVLFGFSRGGLYAFNFALAYPDKVDVLYLDAPALDIRKCPGGFGKSPRMEKEWAECAKAYGLTDETVMEFNQSPLDKIEQLAKTKISVIIVAGGADEVVLFDEHSKVLFDRLKELGHNIKLILKPDCGHHPHSLEDPSPIVDFILENI